MFNKKEIKELEARIEKLEQRQYDFLKHFDCILEKLTKDSKSQYMWEIKQQEIAGKLDIEQQKVNIDKAKLLNQQNEFEQKLEYEDVNKQADREAKRLDIKVKASTEIVNDQIRNANQSTMI